MTVAGTDCFLATLIHVPLWCQALVEEVVGQVRWGQDVSSRVFREQGIDLCRLSWPFPPPGVPLATQTGHTHIPVVAVQDVTHLPMSSRGCLKGGIKDSPQVPQRRPTPGHLQALLSWGQGAGSRAGGVLRPHAQASPHPPRGSQTFPLALRGVSCPPRNGALHRLPLRAEF